MRNDFEELWQSRYLLRMLVARSIKIRYKNSLFGYVWSIVPLILNAGIYTFLVRGVLAQNAPSYTAYLLCGFIPWQFMEIAVLDASSSILEYYPIIRKISMPREVIPLANVLSNFVHFGINWAVYFILFAIVLHPFQYGIPLLPTLLWFPVITIVALLTAFGTAMWIAALNVFYEDVKFMVQTFSRLLFFVMPILYPAEKMYAYLAKHHLPWLYTAYMMLPPVAVIDGYKKTVLQPQAAGAFDLSKAAPPFNIPIFLCAAGISVVLAYTGYAYFNARKWRFVERN
jgi:ABC-type polysaccharide/polyol phosphate export permease